jgi:hypothetical protein
MNSGEHSTDVRSFVTRRIINDDYLDVPTSGAGAGDGLRQTRGPIVSWNDDTYPWHWL